MKQLNKRALLVFAVLWMSLAPRVFGDTFLIVTEEFRNGDYIEAPTPSQEGVMSAMFDLGHITFETGMYRPEMEWDRLAFAEPMLIARQGGARFLAAVRVFAEVAPRRDGPDQSADAPPFGGREITSRAEYLLFDAETSLLLGRGELTASNLSGERALSYDELLFKTGEGVARELVGRLPRSGAP